MPIPIFGVNVFKMLKHVKELHVPILRDAQDYGLVHRAWYFTHQMIIVSDADELANVRSVFLQRLTNRWG